MTGCPCECVSLAVYRITALQVVTGAYTSGLVTRAGGESVAWILGGQVSAVCVSSALPAGWRCCAIYAGPAVNANAPFFNGAGICVVVIVVINAQPSKWPSTSGSIIDSAVLLTVRPQLITG